MTTVKTCFITTICLIKLALKGVWLKSKGGLKRKHFKLQNSVAISEAGIISRFYSTSLILFVKSTCEN